MVIKNPLNILVIAGDLDPLDLGGAEVHIVEVINGLAKRGHTLHVFVGRDTTIRSVLAHRNIHLHAVPYHTIKNLAFWSYTRAALRHIRAFLKQHPEIDILHAKAVFPYGLIAAKLTRRTHIPFYLTVQNPLAYKEELVIKSRWIPLFLKKIIQSSLRPWARKALVCADMAACVSRYSETESKKLGARRTTLVPNGFDHTRFKPPATPLASAPSHPAPPTKNSEFWITTTSTLIPRNGIDTLVDAFAILSLHHPEARLKIAGEGPMRERLEEMIRGHGLVDKVEFLGTLRHDDIPVLLHRSHLFVRPSRFEGFGVSFIEAMACGVPVIACPRGGITDFVTHQKTGWLVEPDDPEALAEAMSELMDDAVLYAKLRANALKMVQSRYIWDTIVDRVEKLYGELRVGIENPSPPK